MKRVYCIHPCCKDLASFLKYIRLEGGVRLNEELVWDANNPDILFSSEWISIDKRYFKQFKELHPKAKVNVMFAMEAVEPDFNLFDYAVGFDDNLNFGDRFFRLMSPMELFPGFIPLRENTVRTHEQALQELKRKSGFCNFLYSNYRAHPMRDQLFYALGKYKRVDSLGRHLNNVGKKGTGFSGHAAECTGIKAPYKFSIASENACYPGYTSEKLFTSLTAHTVPIYFGNPNVGDDVNPKAFISVSDFSSLEELVEYVRKVDADDDLWAEYVCQPWLTERQKENAARRNEHYILSMRKIFESPVEDIRRIPVGSHVASYQKAWFSRNFPFEINRQSIPHWVVKLKRKYFDWL